MNSKYKYINVFLFVILIATISFNCKKTEIEQFNTEGSITGSTVVNDIFSGVWQYYTTEGISVQIENTELSTVTDEDGNYTISNIPSGTYNLVFSLDGYAEMKQCGVQVIGESDYPKEIEMVRLVQKSTTVATNLRVEYIDDEIIFTANFSPESNDSIRRGFFFFISDTENVAFDNNLDWYNAVTNVGSEGSYTITEEVLAQWVEGFDPSSTYYAVAYGSTDNFSSYFDPEKGSYVYTGLNETPTNVVSFAIPSKK